MATNTKPSEKKSKQRPRRGGRHANSSKHTHVTDDDGWTHVVRGPAAVRLVDVAGRRSARHLAAHDDDSSDKDNDHNSDNTGTAKPSGSLPLSKVRAKALPGYMLAPPPLTSLAELQAEHARQAALLAGSEVLRALRAALEAGLRRHGHAVDYDDDDDDDDRGGAGARRRGTGAPVVIRRAVCVGLGSLCTFRRGTSMRQLLAFEMVLDALREWGWTTGAPPLSPSSPSGKERKEERDEGLEVYFQEICFTPLDEQFLASRGYRVLRVDSEREDIRPDVDGRCWLGPFAEYMTESTFFYAPHLEQDVIRRATARAVPALYLGNNIYELDTGFSFTRGRGRVSESGRSSRRARHSSFNVPRESSGKLEGQRETFVDDDDHVQSGLSERWLRCTDWIAPSEVKNVGDDSRNWASDFAFAFRRRMNVDEEIRDKREEENLETDVKREEKTSIDESGLNDLTKEYRPQVAMNEYKSSA